MQGEESVGRGILMSPKGNLILYCDDSGLATGFIDDAPKVEEAIRQGGGYGGWLEIVSLAHLET